MDIKYGQKSIVHSVSYTTGNYKMMFHISYLICICLLRPLQVVIQFLVRASPKSRAGRVGLVIMSLFHFLYALTLKLDIDRFRWTQLLKELVQQPGTYKLIGCLNHVAIVCPIDLVVLLWIWYYMLNTILLKKYPPFEEAYLLTCVIYIHVLFLSL